MSKAFNIVLIKCYLRFINMFKVYDFLTYRFSFCISYSVPGQSGILDQTSLATSALSVFGRGRGG